MKRLITERDITELLKQGSYTLVVENEAIITPSARDLIKSNNISVVSPDVKEPDESGHNFQNVDKTKKCIIASDHTGFAVKQLIAKYLKDKGYEVTDAGTYSEESCDYPDFALKAARAVANGEEDFGIILDATGIPSAITANKIRGIRAATCYNEFSSRSSRLHNNCNVLVLGAKTLGEETIKSIIDVWLKTPFEGGRHQRRIDKISSAES